VKADRQGIEPTTCQSQVQRPTITPPCNIVNITYIYRLSQQLCRNKLLQTSNRERENSPRARVTPSVTALASDAFLQLFDNNAVA